MKTLILSDIHANIVALEAIWAQEGDADLILCTGDLVDYGPFPREVLDWVRAHDVICTQGNHDGWTVLNFQEGRRLSSVAEHERAWVHYTVERLTADDIGFLAALPKATTLEIDGQSYGLTHLFRDYQEIVSLHAFHQFNAESFDDGSLARLILGHTHRQAIRYLSNDHLWINPGSASYRRNDDPDQSAHYATLVDGVIQLHRLDYDLSPLRSALETIHLNENEMRAGRRFFGAR
ncbi:MAG: metallophosphoesterase family protein [Caldilineaceae bacterium]